MYWIDQLAIVDCGNSLHMSVSSTRVPKFSIITGGAAT